MKNEKIKAIIFDYGGVLSTPGKIGFFCERYATKLNKNPEEFMELIKENWNKAKINKIKSTLFWTKAAEFLEIDSEKFRRHLLNSFKFQEGVLIIIKTLKENYKVVLLSNQLEDWLEEVIKEKELDKVFDVIVTSYTSKIAKPDIMIFKETVEKLEVKPEECIYVDDLEKNIPPAKKLGMKTILFKNNKQLINDLKKFGVKV